MNIRIKTNFNFSVSSIQYAPNGELQIILTSGEKQTGSRYQYTTCLGSGQAEEKPAISLLGYARSFASSANVKSKTKDSYRLMCNHLETYGDITIDRITTDYLQDYIQYLQSQGLKPGSVRLYFQKLACVLHDAYKNGLFDDRILQRVKRPKREQEKKGFLTETELKKLTKHRLPEEYNNIQKMFLFSCMTGLRYSDVQGLRWMNVKRNGKHLQLEFRQQKTDTYERLPLCAEAEALLRAQKRSGEYVFKEETNQKVNVVLKRWCKKAKIKKPVSFHSARHTFCVLLLTKDVPIYTVQQLMCHSDIADAGTTTFTYDPAGNLTKEINPLGGIFYSYTYYRPKEKRYSYMTGSGMTYDYDIGGLDALYHPDHLGSASWITNKTGDAIQHLQYLPFGAPFVNQYAPGAGYQERFTFTGKERDKETGYGYFGARYMDHELMTMWLSADPLADKYPNISPYNYCMWNPIKLVDPDGRDTTVGIDFVTGNVDYYIDTESYNGTFVELTDGGNFIDIFKCNGEISVDNDEGKRDLVTFSDNRDALKTFRNLTGEEVFHRQSSVEWNYYEQKDGTGVLVTCHNSQNVCITGLEKRFNKTETSALHHYHPKGPGIAHWTPSESDQQYAKDLKIPCYLHFSGQKYRFDNIVSTYDVMDHDHFQKHIPLGINIYQ